MASTKSVATFSRYAGWVPTEIAQMRLEDDWVFVAWIAWVLFLLGSLVYVVFFA
jgi:hypothetical protein